MEYIIPPSVFRVWSVVSSKLLVLGIPPQGGIQEESSSAEILISAVMRFEHHPVPEDDSRHAKEENLFWRLSSNPSLLFNFGNLSSFTVLSKKAIY